MKSTLSNENINSACDWLEEILVSLEVDRKTAIKSRLAFEEVLLKYQNEFGAQQEFEYHEEKKFGKHKISISVRASYFDPFSTSQEEDIMYRLMENMGVAPSWSYKRNCNYVVFSFAKKQKISELAKISIAILLAVVLGIVFNLKHDTAIFLGESVLSPIFDTIMGMMMAFASLMIFLSVVNGICGMGDISSLQNIGKKTIVNFLTMLFVYGFISLAVLLPFFNVSYGESGSWNLFPVYKMILEIIPNNILTPFINGNLLQVIVLAVCISMAIIMAGEKLAVLRSLFSQINIIVTIIVTTITTLIPVAVFISVFRIIVNNHLEKIFSSYKYILLHFLCFCILFVTTILRMTITQKINPLTFLKKFLPTGMIGMATASSVAAFSTNVDTCENKLGIDKKLVNIGIPLGQVIFMPSAMYELLVSSLFMCELYGITITWTSIFTIFVMAYLLSIATPPIPGSSIACNMLVFTQLGIPMEAITIIIAFDFIIDRISTAINLMELQVELSAVAGKLGLLDKETLHAE